MAFVTRRISDLSGEEIPDEKVLTVTIKGHPDLDGENKLFDCTSDELAALKTVIGLVELEVKDSGNQSWTLYATKGELAKVVTDDKLKSLPGTRGRRPGWRPGVTNGS